MRQLGANITGTKNTTYDLDKLSADSRTNAEKALVLQVWEYNPSSSDPIRRLPRPVGVKVGQIWVAKKSDRV